MTGRAQTASVNVAGVDLNASVTCTAKVTGALGADGTGTVQLTRNPPTASATVNRVSSTVKGWFGW